MRSFREARAWSLVLLTCAIAFAACGGGGGSTSAPANAPPANAPSANPLATASPVNTAHSATPSPGTTSGASPAPTHTVTGIAGPAATLQPIATAPNGGWAPYAVANAFGLPVQDGFDGSGITVAVINDYPPNASDVNAYLAAFHIARTASYSVVNVDGGSPQSDREGLLESTLDVETIEGLAPGANVIYYATPDLSSQALLDAYDQILSDGKANVVNMSYGGCEGSVASPAENPLFAQGVGAGIAFVAASGDYGDECFTPSGNAFGVNYPASDPGVIGVGGTQTSTTTCQTGQITSQQAWNDACKSGHVQEATGGGSSTMFSLPSYQFAAGVSGKYRNVPDVAMPAAFAGEYLQGSWILVGGTSWSAPQVAAMIASTYQYCEGPLASPQEMFYSAFSAKGYGDFTPVTSGNNRYGSDETYYTANGGFSDVSGIGIPNGMAVANTVCPNRVPTYLTRAYGASTVLRPEGGAQARTMQRTPSVRGLSDLGHRTENATMRVALVLYPTSTVATDEQTVISNLTSAGFSIVKTFPNHLVIDAQAPTSVVASYFQTQIDDFAQGQYGTRYANVTPIVIPAGIAKYVQSVVADNVIVAKPQVIRIK